MIGAVGGVHGGVLPAPELAAPDAGAAAPSAAACNPLSPAFARFGGVPPFTTALAPVNTDANDFILTLSSMLSSRGDGERGLALDSSVTTLTGGAPSAQGADGAATYLAAAPVVHACLAWPEPEHLEHTCGN